MKRPILALWLASGLSVLGGLVPRSAMGSQAGSGAVPVVDFVREVQPIFQGRCLECHGPTTQRGGYRLDHRPTALGGGASKEAAIRPGDSQASPLWRRVSAAEGDESRMPPKGAPLSARETDLIRAWIDQGASWPESASVELEDPLDGWSLRPLVRPAIPTGDGDLAAAGNPVDAFVQARLAAAGGVPAPEADRRTLIRRVTFDLLGLPPTPEEVADFVADSGPQAYERLVDRLLASAHYGERWARHWLDVVHYGDTHGYDKDKPRPNAWPYRDYVIRSFNADKPYSRFVREQIAGDVLYADTAEGIEALGFIAAGPWDFIGHEELPDSKIDGKIARHLDRDDMVANTIGTFTSLTVHCAQCHDHKFDPIPQEDYYRLQAVFAALDRTERRYYRDPELNRRRAALEAESRVLTRQEQELDEVVRQAGGEALKELDRRIAEAEKTARDGQPPEYGYHSAIADGMDTEKWVQVDLGRSVAVDRIVLAPCRDSFNNIGDGFGFPRRFRVEISEDPSFAADAVVVFARTAGDLPNPGIERQTYTAGGQEARYVRVTATRLAPRQNDYIFALAELEVYPEGGTNLARGATVSALDSIESLPRWAGRNLTDGKSPGAVPAADWLAALRAEREDLLERLVPAPVREQGRLNAERREANRRALAALPEPLVAYVGAVHYGRGNFRGTGPDGGRPRPIHLLARGDVRMPGREVGPGALRCARVADPGFEPSAVEGSEGSRRAALARWLTAPDHPLTWRSIVNRIWQQRFGVGLVETPNDFGRMGGAPSHPELLDWLAVEFRDCGQSFKALDRLLVTSATYRQSAAPARRGDGGPNLGEVDPGNRLLGRRTARRLDAEAVRDSLLAVSGVLDPTMYGPGFQDFVIEKPEHSPHYQYHLHDPADPRAYRRSIYRFLVRSQQEPFMVALDCADPSMRVAQRNETLTPLQALALLNSRLAVTLAGRFAARVEREVPEGNLEARVDRAFALAVQRPPSSDERGELAAYARTHGLAATCRLLFNLNEFVFID